MHGGISPEMRDIKQINEVSRFEEPGLNGLLCDLLWADPVDDKIAQKTQFTSNKERDCSCKFGLKPAKDLLDRHEFLSIIRGH